MDTPLKAMLLEVWAYRGFIAVSVKREFQTRWQGTQLGPAWIVIQPLSMILLFTVIFAEIMRPTLPRYDSRFAYSIFLCSGMLTWNFFAELLNRCTGMFHEHANLLKKVHFPKLCLPLLATVSSSLHFAIVATLFLLFLLLVGEFPGWLLLSLTPVLAIQIALGVGLGTLLGTVNVFYRDVQQSLNVILQFWFWLTPIVYLTPTLPPAAVRWLQWNPLWPLIRAYQRVVLEHAPPQWETLWFPAFVALGCCGLGYVAFARLQGDLVDEL
jgi:lipopolysaccharide transport system permease protein